MQIKKKAKVKIKNIIIFSVLALLLTGCTVQINELKQKIQSQKEEVAEESKKDPSEMSLEEIEEELEEMDDLEIEEDLDALDKE